VIRNLISNALKFTERGGKVTVAATPQGRCVSITVSDTGIGIAPEDIGKLFRIDIKFQQLGTDGEEGTGLGLLLCKELIEKNRGGLHVESAIGTGTTVTFKLPTGPLEDASQDACKE
jgi:signal transduction histidine kinase